MQKIKLYHSFDLTFTSEDVKVSNPFLLDIRVTFRNPERTIVVPGFYDGNNTWKVRFSPTLTGYWRYSVFCSDKAFDGMSGTLECIENDNPEIHGALKIDLDHPHHFIYEDGTRYFLMGYECNWLWSMASTETGLKKLKTFVGKLKKYGFNHILMNIFAYDTSWCKGKTSNVDFGPPDIYPWSGSNDEPDFSTINPEFFQCYDKVMDCLMENGITAHLYFLVTNKMVKWPEPFSWQEDMFFKYVTARYQAYPNIVWDLCKEAFYIKNQCYKTNRLKFIKYWDGYNRLVTIHDEDDRFHDIDERLLDFITDQQHENFYGTVLNQRKKRKWPVVNAEYGYEWGPKGENDCTYDVNQSPEEVLRRTYEVIMAGGYPAYYYTYTAWDVIRYDDEPVGYKYYKILTDFFKETRYWKLDPNPMLAEGGRCLAVPYEEYIVYCEKGKTVYVDLGEKVKSYSCFWMNTLTGEKSESVSVKNGLVKFNCPFNNIPSILYIKQT